MADLTTDEQQEIRKLIGIMYNNALRVPNPSVRTLVLIEDLLTESEKCNKALTKLIVSMPVEFLAKGKIRKSLKVIRQAVAKQRFEFRTCAKTALLKYKSHIEISAI